jgi:formylglycine-generating enzyme required for sulfatase activity
MRTPCTTAFFNKVTGSTGGDNKPKTSIRYSAYNNNGTHSLYESSTWNHYYGTPPDSYWNTPYIYESQPRETAGGTPGSATTGGLITALSNARNADLTALIPTGYSWALPTEAQWEYACRAGTNTALNNGKNLISASDIEQKVLNEIAVYKKNGNALKVVGGRRPNAWGLHDMIGNCWEWCRDWYTASLTTATDPFISTTTGVGSRVHRGGAYNRAASNCRSAFRYNANAACYSSYYGSIGFRLALVRS